MRGKRIDWFSLVGKKYGRLTITGILWRNKHGLQMVMYECSCSPDRSFIAQGGDILSGRTSSCGCVRRAQVAERSTTHGHSRKGTAEYKAWKDAKQRATNPKRKYWAYYGGRGITWAEEFNDFEVFLADIGYMPEPGMQVDRIDNDRGYEPGNVRWATGKKNNRNKRNNVYVDVTTDNGIETVALAELVEKCGLDPAAVWHRYKQCGWTLSDSLLTDKSPQHSKALPRGTYEISDSDETLCSFSTFEEAVELVGHEAACEEFPPHLRGE
jgi:hypothetical protein